MGFQKVNTIDSKNEMLHFVRSLLDDVQAFEYMLENDWFESNIVRIGAEQEMCLVQNKTFKPATINMEVLAKLGDDKPWCVTELAKFNLETNLSPREFTGDCLSQLEAENLSYLNIIQKVLDEFDASIILCGILPTLRKHDLEMQNLTPKDRYYALMAAIQKHLLGTAFELRVEGVDELLVKHDSPLLEACNTSFQVHLQVAPKDFVKMYNIAQVLAGPVIAISANSPLVFGRRLWHETRIALFQQSLDTRTTHDHMRERLPRVNFGSGWLRGDITEIYKEDISRFRVLLAGAIEEDSIAMVHAGKTPKLRALQIHNSTVYRWNRPCYGISPNGKPHLRIENRVMPAGPTPVDETANAAFWLGCMVAMGNQFDDITKHIDFADARDNFLKSAKFGIDTTFTWMKDKKVPVTELILKELLPMAREGLKMRKVKSADSAKYLDIIEARAREHKTGARWALRTFTALKKEVTNDEAVTAVTAATVKNQKENKPVHTWKEGTAADLADWHPGKIKVEEFMSTDLFTVQKDDLIEIVAEIMDWRRIRYMPVENSKGELIGLISSRMLLRHFARCSKMDKQNVATIVKDIMIEKPVTVTPETTIMDAMHKMQQHRIGCLPVVKGKELVGIITEMDFLRITSRLMERLEK
ncbi:MAG: CBS domain-containing protein [Haliscomenobacteraceae bacterium CHB4]|nr:Glutamate--cysteine ligase [Saprospiraceae bacterium]MCE7922708.1 CBS domain-containing protein [Haliscomenobacteraceae bacterium CHB4]